MGINKSTFPWIYASQEPCAIDEGDPVRLFVGDIVIFLKGIFYTWETHEDVHKHYLLKTID